MSEKRRLGKGLGALIPEIVTAAGEITEVPLDNIKPNPFQPRQDFGEDGLQELALSIREHGVLQAVVLAPAGEEGIYYLVAGERRTRAARLAGLETVPAIVKAMDRKSMLEVALVENLQREDLSPVEEARGYKMLLEEFDYTQEDLAKRIGRSRPAIANSLRLLSLTGPVLELLSAGKITAGQARPLLSVVDSEKQLALAKQISEEGLTARAAEKMAVEAAPKKTVKDKKPGHEQVDPVHEELQLQIQRKLGTKVLIRRSKRGGSIEIYFYGKDDFERLVNKLLPEGLG